MNKIGPRLGVVMHEFEDDHASALWLHLVMPIEDGLAIFDSKQFRLRQLGRTLGTKP